MTRSEVPFFVVHDPKTEGVRVTPAGALSLLEAHVVILEDYARQYSQVIKGADQLEAIKASGQTRTLRVCRITVDSETDDVERMVAAVAAVAEKNPSGKPPWVLPADDDA